jgi:hypothetical protein
MISRRTRRRLIVRCGREETEEEPVLLSVVCVMSMCPFRVKSMSGKRIEVMISCPTRVLYDGSDLLMCRYSFASWRFQLALPFLVRATLTRVGRLMEGLHQHHKPLR